MPPKKKEAKKGDAGDGPTPESILAAQRFKNSALELQMREKLELIINAESSTRALEAETKELELRLAREEKDCMKQSSSMAKDYEVMNDQLYKNIALLTRTANNLKSELAECESKRDRLYSEKEKTLQQKDREIVIMKAKMTDMTEEFSRMLKTTLEKMKERIELPNTRSFEVDEIRGPSKQGALAPS